MFLKHWKEILTHSVDKRLALLSFKFVVRSVAEIIELCRNSSAINDNDNDSLFYSVFVVGMVAIFYKIYAQMFIDFYPTVIY